MCKCRNTERSHDDLAGRQKRLDARGNDRDATVRESEFSVGLWKDLPESEAQKFRDHLAKLAGEPGGATFKSALDTLGDGWKDRPLALPELMFVRKHGFKGFLDTHVNGLKHGEPYKSMHTKVRAQPFFQRRGRDDRGARQRQGELTHRDGGIVSGTDTTKPLKGVFSEDVTHAKGNVIQTRDETRRQFSEQGAPFIGGASGTIEYLCIALEKQKPAKNLSKDERAEREKLLAFHMTALVAGGHHSLTETLITARAMGYFTDVPDPLTGYDAAMAAFEQRLGKMGLKVAKPLSKSKTDEGKSREQLAFEAFRTEVLALWERYGDQLKDLDRQTCESLRILGDDFADVDRKYDAATKRYQVLKNALDVEIQKVVSKRGGSDRVFTGAELQNRFKAPPKTDKKKSVAYKETAKELDAFDKLWKELQGRTLGHEGSEQALYDLEDKLAAVVKGAEAYIAKHRNDGAKADRVKVMEELIASTRKEMGHLDKLKDGAVTWRTKGAEKLTIEEALQFVRRGVDPSKLGDLEKLAPEKVKSSEVLGAGAVNTVYKVVYADPPNEDEVRVFKPDPEKEELKKAARTIGLDGNDPGYGKRNIAMRRACEALGLGDMIPKADFTVHEGRVGLAMGKAPGRTLYTKAWEEVADYNIKATDELNLAQGYRKNDVTGKWEWKVRTAADLPFDDPPEKAVQVQQQLMGLQWLDGLCGQADRHAENYLVGEDDLGNIVVTGIDNDFSFGKNHKKVDSVESPYGEMDIRNGTTIGEGYCGKPPIIDQATYDKLTDAKFLENFETQIAPLLSKDEVAATRARFTDLVDHARSLHPKYVVADWKTWKSPDTDPNPGVSAQDFLMNAPGRNYYKRDTAYLQKQRQAGKLA